MWKPLEKYECGECGELHEWEDDAEDCCRPIVRTVFLCPICDEKHPTNNGALECILKCETTDNQKTYMASIEELEAKGQERLF